MSTFEIRVVLVEIIGFYSRREHELEKITIRPESMLATQNVMNDIRREARAHGCE